MKKLRIFIIICIVGLLYASCVKQANYPDVPVISFNSYEPFYYGIPMDSAYLRINFTDGNGDIGNIQQEGGPNDLFIIPLVYVYATKTYQPIINSGDTLKFPYDIPNITPTGKDKELNGIIQINFENFIWDDIIESGLGPAGNLYQIQFQVWLYDRSGNKSNVLTTPTINPVQPLQ